MNDKAKGLNREQRKIVVVRLQRTTKDQCLECLSREAKGNVRTFVTWSEYPDILLTC